MGKPLDTVTTNREVLIKKNLKVQKSITVDSIRARRIRVGSNSLILGGINPFSGNDEITSTNEVIGIGRDLSTGFNFSDTKVGIGTQTPFSSLSPANYLITFGLEVNNDLNLTSSALNHGYRIGGQVVLQASGTENIFVGTGAGINNTFGPDNTFVGSQAGNTNVGGQANTFVGRQSGNSNDGDQNSFLGAMSGYHNTEGGYNTFIGNVSGYQNTEGEYNTFIGHSSGYAITTGSRNTLLGRQSGNTIVTGSDNLFLGYQANSGGPTAAAITNSAAIGAGTIVRTNNKIILGNNTQKVGIGLSDDITHNGPRSALEINADPNNTTYTGTGGSGLQFRQLTSASTSIPNTSNKVLTVDADGHVILVDATSGSAVNNANNGLSLSSSNTVVLGNDIGYQYAVLTNDREIPMANNNLVFTLPATNADPQKNRVGFGTTTPQAEVEIYTEQGSLSGNTLPIVKNGTTYGAGWQFIAGGTGAKTWIVQSTGPSNYQQAGKLIFHADTLDVMTLVPPATYSTPTAKVGIQTYTPGRALDVYDPDNPQLRLSRLVTGHIKYTDFETTPAGHLRINPKDGDLYSYNGRVGINLVTSNEPQNTLEINSGPTSPTPSGLRLTNLTATATPVTNPGTGYLTVDNNGDVIYTEEPTGGADDDWYTVGTTTPPTNINDNKYTLGHAYINVPTAYIPLYDYVELGVFTNTAVNNNSVTGYFLNRYTHNAINSTEYAITAIADGTGCNYDNSTNYGGYFQAINASRNYAGYFVSDCNSCGTTQNYGVYASVPDTCGIAIYANGRFEQTGTSTKASDIRFKTNIGPITGALDIIDQLQPRTFTFNTSYPLSFPGGLQFGLIAQEVEPVLPEIVYDNTFPAQYDTLGNMITDTVQYKSINYLALVPINMQAIKELKAETDSLKDIISAYESRFAAIEDILNQCCNQSKSSQAEVITHTISRQADNNTSLNQNYPNPFRTITTFTYTTSYAGHVEFTIEDTYGKQVARLVDSQQAAGNYTIDWEPSGLAAGIYIYTLKINNEVLVKKAVKIE